jgi:hypothetical protein
MSVNAFHEKAGRSQVGSFVFSLDKVFLPAGLATVAMLPSAGKVSPVIDRRYSLMQTADAINYVQEGHARAKVLIVFK